MRFKQRNLDRYWNPQSYPWSLRDHLSDYWPWYVLSLFTAALLVLLAWLISETYLYNVQHHCKPTGQTRSYVSYVAFYDGKTTTLLPQIYTDELYVCDNGSIWE